MFETTNSFEFWGDYAAEYAAAAVIEGFAEVSHVTEREVRSVGYTGTGPTSWKARTAHVVVKKAGFKRRGPYGATEAEVGAAGACPAEWVE
jgi:hypothetical protein